MLTVILATILSLTADFTQTKQTAMMSKPQVSTGRMEYRSPDYIRWAYTTPKTVVWEMNGKKTNVNPQIQGLLRMIMASISGENLKESADFAVQQSGNTYTLTPKKREHKRVFRSIRITMDSKTHTAKRVEMTETNGDITTIDFTNIVTK